MRRESAAHHAELAIASIGKYESSKNVRALRRAISLFRKAAAATPANHPDRAARVSDLGTALQTFYEETRDSDVLGEAVALGGEAVAAAGYPERSMYLSNLCLALLSQYELDEKLTTLHAAVDAARESVVADHPDRARYFSNLSEALMCLFSRNEELTTLEEAANAAKQAVEHCARDDPDRSEYLSDLGLALRSCYEWRGDPVVLSEAVRAGREAVETIALDDTRRAVFLCNLSGTLITQYELTGETSYLDEALSAGRASVAAFPAEDPDRGAALSNVGAALQALNEENGDPAALQEAVKVGRAAVAATALDNPLRALYLTNLSLALLDGHIRSGDVDVLEEGMSVAREAVTAVTGHPDRAGYLANLSHALRTSYERSGDPSLLREAVNVSHDVVAATTAEHPELGGRLSNLCGDLRALYEYSGDLGALDAAVRAGRDAVAVTPPGHPSRGGYLSNLCAALTSLYQRCGDTDVLQEAIVVGREAISVTTPAHSDRTIRLSNLANALRFRSFQADDVPGLQEVLQLQREMVALTPPGHVDRAAHLLNVSLTLSALHEQRPDLDVLDHAIQFAYEAVDATAPDHPNNAVYATALAVALHTQYKRTRDDDILHEGLRSVIAATQVQTASVAVLVSALKLAASMHLSAGQFDQAAAMAEQAVELLPQIASRDLGRGDRAERLVDLAGLASSAATAMITADRPDRALALLEKSRGVMIADALDIRSDLTELRRRKPDLAAEFDELRQTINHLDHLAADSNHQQLADRRIRLHERWSRLLDRIHAIPEFQGFLVPPTIDTLRTAAVDGPIVYVIAHEDRGNALVVVDDVNDPVRVIGLDGLTEDSAAAHAVELRDLLRTAEDEHRSKDEREAARQQVLRILGWLWTTVAEPILRYLGYTATIADDESWPRIWWCPVGIMTFLPLHAAGHHLQIPHTAAVMDRVISSYTPTIRALLHARTAVDRANPDVRSALVVAVPDAPGTKRLPAAVQEAELVRQLIPDATLLPVAGGSVTREDVVAALPNHRIAHFACHCVADWIVPANNRLLLHDHRDAPLTVARITELFLTNGGLAYLSACGTTNTNTDHADEATHLTAAFHLAGYRAVIGTLWPINDTAGAVIAHGVYANLTRNGTIPPDPACAAQALHHVIRRSRKAAPAIPTIWASHIHMGA